jgi:hypothetical protein
MSDKRKSPGLADHLRKLPADADHERNPSPSTDIFNPDSEREFPRQMTVARKIMAKHRNALRALTTGDTSRHMGPEDEKPRYTLEELLAQCDPDAPIDAEEREWLDAPAVGRENMDQ